MSDNFVGEIRMFAGNYAPVDWALCNGQLLPISGNEVLFSLLGTTYGGDGVSTFGLPDLRGRLPMHQGTSRFGTQYRTGEAFGTESVTLVPNQMPQHTHGLTGTSDTADSGEPQSRLFANTGENRVYTTAVANAVNLSGSFLTPSGGSQPHDNRMPTLCVNFIIALFGTYPQQN